MVLMNCMYASACFLQKRALKLYPASEYTIGEFTYRSQVTNICEHLEFRDMQIMYPQAVFPGLSV